MRRSSKVVVALTLMALAIFGCFLAAQGLDDADKWASVASFFVSALFGATGLVVGWFGLRSASPTPPAADLDGGHLVSGSIGRDNIQIGRARDVNIRRHGR